MKKNPHLKVPDQKTVIQEIELARKQLLDLSGRNRMINYRVSKLRTVEIVSADLQCLYDSLVNDERILSFKSDNPNEEEDYTKPKILPWSPASDKSVKLKHVKVPMTDEQMKFKLHEVSKQAKSFFEEQGYAILFMALGMVKWRINKSAKETHRAPLLLIPVELRRASVGAPYKLTWTGDEVSSNICLIEKAKEYNISIPEFSPKEDDPAPLNNYLKTIISNTQAANWEVENYACLDFFRFTKLVLWKDLDLKVWEDKSNPQQKKLFQKLLLPLSKTRNKIGEIQDYDEELNPRETYHILNADPSQIAVIEAVKSGQDIVVEGPPGTGKSQTIANLIAELMAMGKKVLFVSEKMAALEVVKSRLDHSGLGTFCLELHSRKTNKKQFLNTLGQAWNQVFEGPTYNTQLHLNFDRTRNVLNQYAHALKDTIGNRGISLHQLISIKEKALSHYDGTDRDYQPCSIPEAETISSNDWDMIIDELTNLAQHSENVTFSDTNPWHGTNPTFVTSQEIESVIRECADIYALWAHLYESLESANKLFASSIPEFVEDIRSTIDTLKTIQRVSCHGLKSIANPLWDTEEPRKIITSIRRINDMEGLDEYLSTLDNGSLLKLYASYRNSLDAIRHFKFLINALSRLCHISPVYRTGKFRSLNDLVLFILDSADFRCREIIETLSSNPNILAEISDALKDLKLKRSLALSSVNEIALCEATETQILDYLTVWQSKKRFFNKNYRIIQKKLPLWLNERSSHTQENITIALDSLAAYFRALNVVNDYREIGIRVLGSSWDNEITDILYLEKVKHWFEKLQVYTIEGTIDSSIYESLKSDFNYEQLERERAAFFASSHKISEYISDFESHSPSRGMADVDLSAVAKKLLARLKLIRALCYHEKASLLFGSSWKSVRTNPDMLEKVLHDVQEIRSLLRRGKVASDTIDCITILKEDRATIDALFKTFDKWEGIEQATISLLTLLDDSIFRSENHLSGKVTDFIRILKVWSSASNELEVWAEYCLSKAHCRSKVSHSIIQSFESGNISNPDDILPCLQASYVDQLLGQLVSSNPLLSGFKSTLHRNKIDRFIELDKEVIESNRTRLKVLLNDKRPTLVNNASNSSEVGFLLGELNKKRAHRPIRQILKRCGNLVQGLKPCFMMSPLSIAQYLDPGSLVFDTIIFDEASQVRPEDALGSLLRGNQLVVLGDSKQLPPTSFFDHLTEMEEDLGSMEDEWSSASISEIESILQQCLTKLPRKRLNWHYRSKHESLILGSNSFFYDNTLQVFPSPFSKSKDVGLHFEYRPDTIYDRGKGAINKLEAKYVVDLAIEHLTKKPQWSLGIGTFSARQQNLIIDEFESRIRLRPELQKYVDPEIHEHFFVKNLETIQGDERDVIIISTGYGFDDKGQLSMLFGPINNEGGHRRLNVLITRARYKCIIMANFKASDLKIKSTSSLGLKALQSYLQFAETGIIASCDESDTFSSEFVEAIYEFLSGHGYIVKKHVGCVGYRVDLAVCHPSNPDNYAIGIACDGRNYYNTITARERDRLRREILEGLGWTVYSVWAVDWYKRRRSCREDLLNAVKEATKQAAQKIPKRFLPSATQKPLNVKKTEKMKIKALPAKPVDEIKIAEYEYLRDYRYSGLWKYIGYDDSYLPTMIVNAVKLESPIHIDDLYDRFCASAADKSKATNKVVLAAYKLSFQNKILFDGTFCRDPEKNIIPRHRTDPFKLERVYDQEIMALIKLILEKQYSTELHDLCVQVARLLGIKRLVAKNEEIIQKVVSSMVASNTITINTDGIVTLA